MVYRKISSDMKHRALQLVDEGWEIEDVAAILGVTSKSIRGWADNDPSSALPDLHDFIRENPALFLDEVGEWLALYHDQLISTTAFHDHLRELGLTHKILRKAAAERDDAARAEWLIHITSNYTAHQM
ncbi:hypothetical protein M378DRAFT_38929, partial [Amanita muscaria Koide BX008]